MTEHSAPAAEADNAGEERRPCCGGTRRHRVGCDPNRGNRVAPLSTVSVADLLGLNDDEPRPAVSPGGQADSSRRTGPDVTSDGGNARRRDNGQADELRAAISHVLAMEVDEEGWTTDDLADALLSGPLAPLLVDWEERDRKLIAETLIWLGNDIFDADVIENGYVIRPGVVQHWIDLQAKRYADGIHPRLPLVRRALDGEP